MSPAPDIGEVARQPSGHQEDRVYPNIVIGTCIAGREALGGDGNPAKSIFVEREGCRLVASSLLHLDEGNHFSAPRNQVHFAAGNAGAARQDSPAVKPQPPGGDGLGAPSSSFRDLAIHALPAKSNALA